MNNPFDITKAVDFTDEQIVQYWVDISDEGGFKSLLKPTSVMPMIILGSKGSGKTHLMRYFSYELQKIKYKDDLKKGFEDDKFIGIYVRCSSFNSERFSNKGQIDEVWRSIYAYYWELWLTQISLNIIIDLQKNGIIEITNEKKLVENIIELLNKKPENTPNDLANLVSFFSHLQKEVDYEVENCIFNDDKKLHIDILISPSTITYQLPQLIKKYVPFFKDKIFLYLIDELENISENQQRLIQTLIREKNTACTFRIGARLYGIKTYEALGSGEENKEGSEFEEVILDDFLRNNKDYNEFIRKICEHRLNLNGICFPSPKRIDDFIDSFNIEDFVNKIKDKKESQSKSYFYKLKDKLKKYRLSEKDTDNIISNLFSDDVVVERTSVLLFYRDWKENKNLTQSSNEIKNSALEYLKNPIDKDNRHRKVLEKYKRDVIDMLARETREDVPYYGFEEFIKMSSGTPRNLLNILKHAYKWTHFNEDKEAFRSTNVNFEAQAKGIKDTIDWFFEDNRTPVRQEGKPFECVERLGKFLRELKYSDIPPECSINIFGLNLEELSNEARDIFNFLEQYSYIIKTEDRRDKNSNDKFRTYYINGIIAPHWELSLNKRGIVILSSKEAESIFNIEGSVDFETVLTAKRQKYYAPFSQFNNTLDLFAQNA
ncbi:MAG: hypothetical protein LBR45_03815 [Bacteroidales bacterium]|jgi:hypothetical protein|nr:hypothetical protein [Bacteroidales bacterium]